MNELIIVKPEKCTGCNACVRSCPAPEANTVKQLDNGNFIVSVNPDKCVACGECVRSCNRGARDYIDDTEECMAYLIKEKLILVVSPAVKAALPTKWKGVLDWFRGQGCTIYDGSFGADICTWAHVRAIEQGTIGNIVTQPCAAIVKYIETYQPQMLHNLSPIHSPAGCSAIYIKKYLRRNNHIAFLSTCIAKKIEFTDTELIDYNLTVDKLMDYFERNGISIPVDTSDNYEYRFDDQQGQVGSVYSRPGGLRDNLWLHNPDINITTSEGVHKVYGELNMYAKMPEGKHPQVFDVLSCEFGCNVGPAAKTDHTVFDVMDVMRKVESEAKNRRKSGFMGRGDDKLFKRFDEELNPADFVRNYKPSVPSPVPSEQQLEPIYKKMGKHTADDKEYNCHACGFNSCRDMAIAIARGLNTPENCVVHAKSVLLAKHSTLSVEHEKLEAITSECLELSEKLKADIADITSSTSSIDESASATKERATVVKDLLQNIVTFCSENPTMDSDSVEQLIGILNMTIDAFSALDDNVSTTSESSEAINKSVSKIISLVENINEVLVKSTQ
ncbi:MAG: [Fe-Fe] hydrogenase large subunit C-terminal domain-containing protein [Ruminococcus sp.]|nr:[Fe-Fe] hydrogenase large subunit C-terminal domain-containing protein [Ruminococcus sp.]